MIKTLWFDGESAISHGLMISGSGTFDAAERDVEMVSIPGRNGDLIIDNGRYKNIPVSYPASISTDFPGRAEAVRAWLGSKTGYCRLEDDYDPDHFRLARFQGPLRFTPGFLNRTAECTLTFDCKPQRFLKIGQECLPVDIGQTLWNPTRFPARPLIAVAGTAPSGWLVLRYDDGTENAIFFNGYEIPEIWGGVIYLDMESSEIYGINDGVRQSAFAYASFAAPVELKPGANKFVSNLVQPVSGLQVVPRWWTL